MSCGAIGKRLVDWPESPTSSSRRAICPRDKFVHLTSARIGSPAVWSSKHLQEVRFESRQIISISFLRPPPFFGHDSCPGRRSLPVPPVLGGWSWGRTAARWQMYSTPPCPSFVDSMAAYRRRSFFSQRVEQPLHHPFDSRCIGVHAALLGFALQAAGLIPYSTQNRELISGPFPTRQSRNQRGLTETAFIQQNGWWLTPPLGGECHEHSMALLGQVRQPHRLHASLLRSGHFQGPSRLVCSLRARVLRRSHSESSP